MSARKKIPVRKLTPREARTLKQLSDLPRGAVWTEGFWLLVNEGSVTMTKQRTGEPPEWMVEIPRRDFNRFIDWYNTGRWSKK